jgi:2-(1,2-epoxy-1,2-dihydrophenyl)acetyl-CoA isomerase
MTVLTLERVGATAVLTMNRPEQRNALDLALREAFENAIAELRDDAAVKAVVLTGAGGHFCAGGDVKAMGEGQSDPMQTHASLSKLHRWVEALVDLEKPVIAAVDGVAFGAGLSLALAADFVLATPRARFCCVFARIGLVPDAAAMYLLPRAVGLNRAKELVFSARVVEAEEAQRIGIVQEVCVGDVREAALALAERFHAAPTQALGLAKGILNRAFESERSEVLRQESLAQAVLRGSGYHREAVRRFNAKEAPLYQWDTARTKA